MDQNTILKDLNKIFVDTLDNENINLNPDTTAQDVDEWDSLSHIMLIVAIEKHFKIRFTSKEIQSWNNVGEMINCIASK
ncbi:MAG: acyl carrier protein [Flavobacteriales bacterium]|nr:acyl carrier protein [Flavobacteriales bacterium]